MDKQRKIIFSDGHEEVVRFVVFERKGAGGLAIPGYIPGAYDHYFPVTDNITYHLKIYKELGPMDRVLLTDSDLPSLILLKENGTCEFPEQPANGKPDCEKWRVERPRPHTEAEQTRLRSMAMKQEVAELQAKDKNTSKALSEKRAKAAEQNRTVKDKGDRAKIKAAVLRKVKQGYIPNQAHEGVADLCKSNDNLLNLKKGPYLFISARSVRRIVMNK